MPMADWALDSKEKKMISYGSGKLGIVFCIRGQDGVRYNMQSPQ